MNKVVFAYLVLSTLSVPAFSKGNTCDTSKLIMNESNTLMEGLMSYANDLQQSKSAYQTLSQWRVFHFNPNIEALTTKYRPMVSTDFGALDKEVLDSSYFNLSQSALNLQGYLKTGEKKYMKSLRTNLTDFVQLGEKVKTVCKEG